MGRTVLALVLGLSLGLLLKIPAWAARQDDATAYTALDLFSDAFERIRANYVQPVDDPALIDAAINGMANSLDSHSSYMNPKNYAEMQSATSATLGGVGVVLTIDEGLIKVISPIDGAPAGMSGVKAGDYITAIDSQPMDGSSLNDVIGMLRGPIGSRVTLTIARKGQHALMTIAMVRAAVTNESVRFAKKGSIGYIRISGFDQDTESELRKAVEKLRAESNSSIVGYILDIRNCPGGLLDSGIRVSDDFLDSGDIVSTRGRRSRDTADYKAVPGDIAGGGPIVVLVNEGSAAAAEIVAGALQDNHRATIIGMRTFGDGTIQTIIPVGKGALRLTTAELYRPSGQGIQENGITPDIAVAQSAEDAVVFRESALPRHIATQVVSTPASQTPVVRPPAGKSVADFQLSYALDYLNKK